MTQNINYSSVYSAGLKLAGFHLTSCQSTCPRHPTEMSRQHQPGDRVLLVGSQPWRNLGSISLTGGERWRSGFDAQVFLTCWSNGGVPIKTSVKYLATYFSFLQDSLLSLHFSAM